QVNDAVEQHVDALEVGGASAQNWRDGAVGNTGMNAADDLITGKLFTGEVFLKQCFVGLSNRFGNSCGKTVQTMTKVRHLYLVWFALVVIAVCFHVDEVDVALYLMIFNVWNNDRRYCRT